MSWPYAAVIRYSDSIIIKGARSPERLLDEVSLFLRQVAAEDDVRNIYSLTNILEPRGASIEVARSGREAIDAPDKSARETGKAINEELYSFEMLNSYIQK